MSIWKIIWKSVMNELVEEIPLHRAYHDLKLLEPKSKKNEDLLLFHLMNISDLKEFYVSDWNYCYKKLKDSIFKQFSDIKAIGYYSDNPDFQEYNNIFEDNSKNRWVIINIKSKKEIAITNPLQSLDRYNITYCPCGQHGLNLHCAIQHDTNNKIAWVGSDCIKKFMPHIKKKVNILIKRSRQFRKGKIDFCLYCEEVFEKETGKIFCDEICNFGYYTPFMYGKYKGEFIKDVYNKDKNYIDLLNETDTLLWDLVFDISCESRFDKDFIKKIQKLKSP